jgi:Domain of unknown function (DUF1841)
MTPFAGQDREAMRRAWRTAWQRHVQGFPLEPLQAQLADLVAAHPEYHTLLDASLEAPATAGAQPGPDSEGWLHLALHLALREQVGTDRPRGIAQVHRRVRATAGEAHAAEHRMIAVLARTLWDAQRSGQVPDEQRYLEELRRL